MTLWIERPNRQSAPALGLSPVWKYRGQVIPTNKEVITELDTTEINGEEDAILATGRGGLWVDGLRIYEVNGFTVSIREDTRCAT